MASHCSHRRHCGHSHVRSLQLRLILRSLPASRYLSHCMQGRQYHSCSTQILHRHFRRVTYLFDENRRSYAALAVHTNAPASVFTENGRDIWSFRLLFYTHKTPPQSLKEDNTSIKIGRRFDGT